ERQPARDSVVVLRKHRGSVVQVSDTWLSRYRQLIAIEGHAQHPGVPPGRAVPGRLGEDRALRPRDARRAECLIEAGRGRRGPQGQRPSSGEAPLTDDAPVEAACVELYREGDALGNGLSGKRTADAILLEHTGGHEGRISLATVPPHSRAQREAPVADDVGPAVVVDVLPRLVVSAAHDGSAPRRGAGCGQEGLQIAA